MCYFSLVAGLVGRSTWKFHLACTSKALVQGQEVHRLGAGVSFRPSRCWGSSLPCCYLLALYILFAWGRFDTFGRCNIFLVVFFSCLLLLRTLRWPPRTWCGPTRWDLTMCCSQLFVCWAFDCVVFGIHLFLRSLSHRRTVRVCCNRRQRILEMFVCLFVRSFVCLCVCACVCMCLCVLSIFEGAVIAAMKRRFLWQASAENVHWYITDVVACI